MGVIVWEGIVVTVLVLVGFREAVMNAVPLALKRAIGVGIGLFILFIGFANGGFVVAGLGHAGRRSTCPRRPADFVFWIGLILTIVLCVLKVRAALIISILITTIIALIAGVTKSPTTSDHAEVLDARPVRPDPGLQRAAAADGDRPDLHDHADRLLRHDGHRDRRGRGGRAGQGGRHGAGHRPRPARRLASPRSRGGLAGISSNTTYIESAAGVAEGGRTGLTSVVTGVLFLLVIFLSPIAGIVPSVATAPALILVGYLMFTQVKDIDVSDVEDGIPALLTMILMPLTYNITVGIGAGFITWVFIKVAGQGPRDPPADVGRGDPVPRVLRPGLVPVDPAQPPPPAA